MTQDDRYSNAKKIVQARRGLYGHAMTYVIVNGALFMIDYLTPGGPWFYWPLIGWGVGLLINVLVVLTGLNPGSVAEERAIQRYLEKHSG